MNAPFEILYEEGAVIVINKPSGILTQGPPGIESVELELKKFLKERDQTEGPYYLGIIHRLDRPASGVLLFTKTKAAAKDLSLQFQQRRVSKNYWAFVEGTVEPTEGIWRDHVYKIHGMAKTEVVPEDHPGAKHAILRYNCLLSKETGTWLEIELETGRTHQIRLQSSSRFYPIHGDAQYGSNYEFGVQHELERDRAIALHARMLMFSHPETNEQVEILAPPPEQWNALDLPLDLF